MSIVNLEPVESVELLSDSEDDEVSVANPIDSGCEILFDEGFSSEYGFKENSVSHSNTVIFQYYNICCCYTFNFPGRMGIVTILSQELRSK